MKFLTSSWARPLLEEKIAINNKVPDMAIVQGNMCPCLPLNILKSSTKWSHRCAWRPINCLSEKRQHEKRAKVTLRCNSQDGKPPFSAEKLNP